MSKKQARSERARNRTATSAGHGVLMSTFALNRNRTNGFLLLMHGVGLRCDCNQPCSNTMMANDRAIRPR